MTLVKKMSISIPQHARATSNIFKEFVNRNPRNLERMQIARKPEGYHLEKPGRRFWHKLELTVSSRTVTAQVVHFLNGPVIEAKTSEWPLRKQLYSVKDTSAYINLGRVLGQRCLESGISEMYCNIQPVEGGKIERFLTEVVNSGVKLEEPDRYKKPNPWDEHRPEKPWEITDE